MKTSWTLLIAGCSLAMLMALAAALWMRQSFQRYAAECNCKGPDLLEKESQETIGPRGIDCGEVLIADDPKTATACAMAAQMAGKPFRVRYDLRGFDSVVAVAVVRDVTGIVAIWNYDSDPSGGGRVGGGIIDRRRCPEPVKLETNSKGRISCFQKASATARSIMSPNLEPY
jgi:hypothetical protein